MKKPLSIGAALFLLAGVADSQLVNSTNIVSTNLFFTVSSPLVGNDANVLGTQLSAMTNGAGVKIFSVPALTNYFGPAGVTHQLVFTVQNNPTGGTNLYTITPSLQ